ncbi:MAG: hypothetical protein AB2421_06840 [Thermotaleaceae bacterium]
MKANRNIVKWIMLLMFCVMVLVACDTSTEAPEVVPPDAPEEVTNEDTTEKNDDPLKELGFIYKDNAIVISDTVDDQKIENLLGKADEIKSHTYSEQDGLNMDSLNGMTEKQYQYPGLLIKTIDATADKGFFVFSIEITDPKYPTIRDIKVGDSFEKLIETYPEGRLLGGELSDEEDDFRYEPIDYVNVMNFHIKDKKVESILIFTLLD